MFRVHSTKEFFPAFGIHRCQLAHKFVARFPFRILARANSDRKKRGDNPNGDVCRSHQMKKEKGGTTAGSRSADTNSNASAREKANAFDRGTHNTGYTHGKESSCEKERAFGGAT